MVSVYRSKYVVMFFTPQGKPKCVSSRRGNVEFYFYEMLVASPIKTGLFTCPFINICTFRLHIDIWFKCQSIHYSEATSKLKSSLSLMQASELKLKSTFLYFNLNRSRRNVKRWQNTTSNYAY
jgi:hypothetical protein